jgi:8-oxo-dGTP pyrophosphatase MutT (NUDIX family)
VEDEVCAGQAEPLPASLAKRLAARLEATPEALDAPPGARPAAVLALLAMAAGEPAVLVLERSPALRRHAGQPALPGGACDQVDAGSWDTARREAEEEVGVAGQHCRPLGTLPALYIPVSGFWVTPWVAAARTAMRPHPASAEAARVFWVPLRRLREAAAWEQLPGHGSTWFPVFPLPERNVRIWGATAWMLAQLLRRWPWHED